MPLSLGTRAPRRSAPAVVRIDGVHIAPIGPLVPTVRDHSSRFFKQFFNQQRNRKGLGAGILFDEEGLILTTAQTVEKADYLMVHLTDGRIFAGALVGLDPVTDLAVVKVVAPAPLPVAPLGNSDALQTGDWAIATGKNPAESDSIVTTGIIINVSYDPNRSNSLSTNDKQLDLIQTNAVIDHSYSGGPLLNVDGEVIGINTLAYSGPEEHQALAIPIKTALAIAKQLISTGLSYPTVGVSLRPLTPALAQTFNQSPENVGFQLPHRHGVLIVDVWPQSPADQVGLLPGDVVISVEDSNVTTPGEFFQAMESTGVGGQLHLNIWRQEQKKQVTVIPEEMADQIHRVKMNSLTPLPSPGPY